MLTTQVDIDQNSIVYIQVLFLKLVLMWPIHSQTRFKTFLVYVYYWFLSISICLTCVTLLAKALKTTDLVNRSEAIDILTLTASAFFKYRFFITNHEYFRNFVYQLDKEFPRKPFYGRADFTTEAWMKWSAPLAALHATIGFVTITFWVLCPIIKYLCGMTSIHDMPLPINVWYPFDYNNGTIYCMLYVVHAVGVISCAHVYMACDGFLFSIIYFVNGQLEILKKSLIGIEDIKKDGYESVEEARHNGFKKCVQHHAKILHFLKELDIVFRSMICADVLHAIISLSFAMLQTSEAKGVLEQIKMVTFVGYCFVHQYLNSLFGQLLINQVSKESPGLHHNCLLNAQRLWSQRIIISQESLMIDVYGVNWADRSVSFRRSVHIMMGGGCIKPVKLSAWRMYFLQYETFVEFVRSMVSFFMVLRTLTDQGMIKENTAGSE